MQTTLRIRRYNPENPQPAAYFESYDLELDPSDSVLDGLIKIRETLDDSLTLRCSCRGAICGSCGMRINGHAALACKTKVVSVAPAGETIEVEPMNNMPVILGKNSSDSTLAATIGASTGSRIHSRTGNDEPFNRCNELHHVRCMRLRLPGTRSR